MRRFLLVLLAILPATAGPEEDKKTLLERLEWDFKWNRSWAHRRVDNFLRRWPRANEAPRLLLRLAKSYGMEGWEHAVRLEALRRLVREYPQTTQAYTVLRRLKDLTGFGFSEFETRFPPGRLLRVTRGPGPSARYTIYRIPAAASRKAWLEGKPEDLRRSFEARLPDELPRLHATTIRFREDEDEHDLDFRFADAGAYVVQEEVSGFAWRRAVFVHRLQVASKHYPDRTLVVAVDPDSGEPVPGVQVNLRTQEEVLRTRTDEQGMALFQVGEAIAILVSRGDEVLGWRVWSRGKIGGPHVFVTTDRPIYRPGHEVHWKAVRRDLTSGRIDLPPRDEVRVEVRDPQGRTLLSEKLRWNEAGTISASFRLADEPPLGNYSILVHEPAPYDFYRDWWFDDDLLNAWTRDFRVEAYRKPEVEVTVEPLPAKGSLVRARIRARTFTGAPIAGAAVKWSVAAEEVFSWHLHDRRAPYDDERDWWRAHFSDLADNDWDEDHVVAEGEGVTGADGTLVVSFEEIGRPAQVSYRVEATVTDLTGLSATGGGRIERRGAAFDVQVATKRAYREVGETLSGRVRIRDLDDRPVASRAVELVAFLDEQDSGWDEFESFHRVELRTNEQGEAHFEVPVEAAGSIRLRARVRDDEGRRVEDRTDARAVRLGGAPVEAGEVEDRMEVLPDRAIYEPGDRIRLLVRARATPLQALLLVEGSTLLDARFVELTGRFSIVEIPVTAAMAPKVRVKLHAWKDGESWGAGWEVFIYPRGSFLEVSVGADRAAYLPGETARVRIETRHEGRPVPGEVELAVVDESLYQLVRDHTPDLRVFFFPQTEGEFGSGGFLTLPDDYDEFERKLDDSEDPMFGGVAEEELQPYGAIDENEAPQVRRRFADTLHWQAHVRTDADGTAEVPVTMPDNLTRWRIVARAVSGADRFGVATSSTLTRQDVVVRIGAPRFFTEGDVAEVATVVRNDTGKDARFEVRFAVEGAEGGGERTVSVPAGEERRLRWPLTVGQAGSVRLRAVARSSAGQDAIEIELPVHAFGIEMTKVHSGAIAAGWVTSIEFPEDAEARSSRLEIHATTTVAACVRRALPYLAGYPYGCVEQTLSRFLPSVVAAQALRRLGLDNEGLKRELPWMVRSGLQRLYAFQHEDGGWGWWTNDDTDKHMTAYVVFGLAAAKRAGFDVDQATLDAGAGWLRDSGEPFALFARAQAGVNVEKALAGAAPRTLEERCLLVLAGRKDLAKDLGPPRAASGYDRTRLLGLVLWAVATADPKDVRIPDLVKELLLLRRGSAWITTLDSAYAVFGLAAAAAAERPAPVAISLNGRAIDATVVPGAELRPGANRLEARGGAEPWASCTAVLRYRSKADPVPPHAGALALERRFEVLRGEAGKRKWARLRSGDAVRTGEELRVVVRAVAKEDLSRLLIEAYIPAGTEALASEPEEYDWYDSWYLRREIRDDRVVVAIGEMSVGDDEQFVFRLRPTIPGTYRVRPALAFAMYEPGRRAWSSSFLLKVLPR